MKSAARRRAVRSAALMGLITAALAGAVRAETIISTGISGATVWAPDAMYVNGAAVPGAGGSPYIITADMPVSGAATSLIITTEKTDGTHAGVLVMVQPGRQITISSGGALTAAGTPDTPVVFQGAAPDDVWRGIRATAGSTLALDHCRIDGGGADRSGAIDCTGAAVTISRTRITGSRSSGIFLSGGSGVIAHCEITDSAAAGISLNSVAPFSVDESLILRSGHTGIAATATNARIRHCAIQHSGGSGITISGSSADQSAVVSDCVISHNHLSGIAIGANLAGHFRRNTLAGNNPAGRPDAYAIGFFGTADSRMNVYDNDIGLHTPYPLRMAAAGTLAESNRITVDGATMGIEVRGGTIDSDTTWHDFGVPYIVRDTHLTVVSTIREPVLTLRPGTTVMFDESCALQIGLANYFTTRKKGILAAVGTPDNPITLTAGRAGGYWKGLIIYEPHNSARCRIEHCIVEYGGLDSLGPANGHDATIFLYNYSAPAGQSLFKNTTVRYSRGDGICLWKPQSDSTFYSCTFYGNAAWDLYIQGSPSRTADARLNYWGTPNGPSADLCSSAAVGDDREDVDRVGFAPWLVEECGYPFRFATAAAEPAAFNPGHHTTIAFSLTAAPLPLDTGVSWRLDILNSRFEQIWSTSGPGTSGTVVWDGMGTYGAASGTCYYRISAVSPFGAAAPVMGNLEVGNRAVARIVEPASGQLFGPGSRVPVRGTASLPGGSYALSYGQGEQPEEWHMLAGGPAVIANDDLVQPGWDTAGLSGQLYTLKLEVQAAGTLYVDIARVQFFAVDPVPPDEPERRVSEYGYDRLGRLTGIRVPAQPGTGRANAFISYDRAGNRVAVEREVPTLARLVSFAARPSLQGVALTWRTAAEPDTAGFRVYRSPARENAFKNITPAMIAARGSATGGFIYRYRDVPPRRGGIWDYLLEEVDVSGRTVTYGPVTARSISLPAGSGTKAFTKENRGRCD